RAATAACRRGRSLEEVGDVQVVGGGPTQRRLLDDPGHLDRLRRALVLDGGDRLGRDRLGGHVLSRRLDDRGRGRRPDGGGGSRGGRALLRGAGRTAGRAV